MANGSKKLIAFVAFVGVTGAISFHYAGDIKHAVQVMGREEPTGVKALCMNETLKTEPSWERASSTCDCVVAELDGAAMTASDFANPDAGLAGISRSCRAMHAD